MTQTIIKNLLFQLKCVLIKQDNLIVDCIVRIIAIQVNFIKNSVQKYERLSVVKIITKYNMRINF